MASFTIIFDVDKNSPTYGKWLFTDTTDYAALGWTNGIANRVGWFTINFPNGNSYSGSQTNPDLGNGQTINNSISIPQDANGNWLQGTYTFTLNLFTTDPVLNPTSVGTITYKYCPPFKFGLGDEGSISTQTDCFQYRLGITDKTHYGTPTTKTELITLYPPQPLIDNNTATAVTSNSSSLLYVFGYTGTYVATVDTLLTYLTTFTNGSVTVTGRVTADKEISVQCSLNICNLIACYNDKLRKLTHQISKGGYLESVDNALKTDMLMASFYLLAYKENAACGNYDRATDDYNKLAKVLNCDCNCGDKNAISDDIRLVNPSFNTSIAQIYNAIGQGAVQVTTNTVGNNTTFTITLSQTLINLINSNASSITTIEGDITLLTARVDALEANVTTLQSLVPVLLYSDTTVSGTANTSGDQFLKTYTLQAGTLGVDGDIIEVQMTARKNSDARINMFLRIGGETVFSSLDISPSLINTISSIVRISDSSQFCITNGTIGGQPNVQTILRIVNSVSARKNTSVNLTNNQNIEIRFVKPSGNFTVNEVQCLLLTIKHYKK
jgi:hypothetical protein